ncbi:LPXTG cell wall anchor domain-containing protein [Kaistella sp.]
MEAGEKTGLTENEQFKIYLIILGVLLIVSLVILVLKRKKN